MQIVVNGQTFKSQSALQEYCKEILYRGEVGSRLDEEELKFMVSFFEEFHHEWIEKKGIGVSEIYRVKEPKYKKYRAFLLSRLDGTITDISYLIGRIKKRDILKEFKSACRDIIKTDIDDFRNNFFLQNTAPVCPLTGEFLVKFNSHVDHENPTFDEIVASFLGAFPDVDLQTLISIPQDNQHSPRITNKSFVEKFVIFHRRVAKLRVVSITGNLSIAKRNKNKYEL